MAGLYNEMTNKGFEVKFYDRHGNTAMIRGCDDIVDVANVLIETCNGCTHGKFPTIWFNGELVKTEVNRQWEV